MDAEHMKAALEAVRDLHIPASPYSRCRACRDVNWPCPTVNALNGFTGIDRWRFPEASRPDSLGRLHKQLVDIAFDEDLDIITTPAGMDHDEVESLAFAYQQYLREIQATLTDPGWLAVL